MLSVKDYEKLLATHLQEFQRFCRQVGQKAKQNLKAKIGRKLVKCNVQSRDSYGRLVCKVSLA